MIKQACRRSPTCVGALTFTLVCALALGGAPVSWRAGLRTLAPLQAEAAGVGWSSAPFISAPADSRWYRLPAITRDTSGRLYAFAERRDNNTSDFGDFDVVMRRSDDGGRSWSALKVVANDGRNRVSNPVPAIDPFTGEVLLITSIRGADNVYRGVYLQRSRNRGESFSPLLSGRIRASGTWRGGLPGCGHAAVLAWGPHAGRIIVPLGYRTSTYYGAYGIYSDDGGRSWKTGYDQAATSGTVGLIEGTVAQLPSGDVTIHYRDKLSTTPGTTRLLAVSSDGGASLSRLFTRQANLKIHSVAGSALNLSGGNAGMLLFSAPSYTSAADRTLRRDMSIFVSKDGGWTWRRPYPVELESKPGSYSDLVQTSSSSVGILYETGVRTWRERIVFRHVPVAELISPVRVASSVRGVLSKTLISTTSNARVKVTVRVDGIGSPPGKVTVKYAAPGRRPGSRAVTLTYSNRGVRFVTLPHLKRGDYKVTVVYHGTVRILGKTVSAGTLKVR